MSDKRTETEVTQKQAREVSSADLLGSQRKLVIEHKGEHYTLRITSKDKLILTK